ncbi:MAG: hypothetical protein DRR19_14785 [Candidatus Parabeggiatoa sp. nov. 1]|nr:MAG: hypothetical protein DRR19_14785 [Gammaproteobacteria bacterium]
MLRAILFALWLAFGQSVYAQENPVANSSENTQKQVADTASEDAEEDVTAEVVNALSGLRETIEKARKEAEDVLKEIPEGKLTSKDKVKERFTTVINGIRTELKKLQPGSDLSNAISDLIVLAEYQIEELEKLGDAYKNIVKGWEQLRSDLNKISFQIKENREKLYDQLTDIVRNEQRIIQMLKLKRAQKAVAEIKKVVSSLNNVRGKLKKWTADAEKSIDLTAGKSPQ